MKKWVAELLGTFALVFCGTGSPGNFNLGEKKIESEQGQAG